MKTKILFINSDITPYTPDGTLSATGRALIQGMHERGHETRNFMPRYGQINERRCQLHEVIRLSGMNIIINETDHPLIIKVGSIPQTHIPIYFIDNDDYFTNRRGQFSAAAGDAPGIETTAGGEYADNAERCIFFARGVIETIRKQRWTPDVIYCQGWFSAITPLYMRRAFADDPNFRNAKIVFDVTEATFRSPLPATTSRIVHRDGITRADLNDIRDHEVSADDLCRLAIRYSDGVVVSNGKADTWLDYAAQLGLPAVAIDPVADYTDRSELADRYEAFFDQLTGPLYADDDD